MSIPNKNKGAKIKSDLPDGKILSTPGYILFKINPDNVRKDLIRWRGIYNDKKRTIRVEELQRNSRPEPRNDSETETEASHESPRPRRKFKVNKNRRGKTTNKKNREELGFGESNSQSLHEGRRR